MPKISDLPIFPRLHLFSFLNTKDALSASSVDKESIEFQNTDLFWHQRVQNDFFCKVPADITPRAYHAQWRSQEAPLLATLFKALILNGLDFELSCLHRYAIILNEPRDFLELFNGLFDNIMSLYKVYDKYAAEFRNLPMYPEHITALVKGADFNKIIEDYAAKLLALPMGMELASPDECTEIYVNLNLPNKLPLDFLILFAELKMWHKVRHFLSSLKRDELANVLDRVGQKLVRVCIRYGNAEELRWLIENISLKITHNELISLAQDLVAFALNMEAGIKKIQPARARNHEDHGVTLEQYQLLTERLQDDPETLKLLSTFSLNLVREHVWTSKKKIINEYYAYRINAFHQLINLCLQQGVDTCIGIGQNEDGTIITVRYLVMSLRDAIAETDQIAQERKPILIGVLNKIINAQIQNVQELNSQSDNDDQQSHRRNTPGKC